jgi:3-deoxy-manno-octulosonate cytidylyltransferase (CMP-KDO synthetase)
MKTVIIIPARYKSSRFPGKPLIKLFNKPMIQWVAETSEKVVGKENVYVATEDARIKNAVEQMGYCAIMTSERNLTGTDRIAEASQTINADIYVNVQGDEPLVHPEDIQKIISAKKEFPRDVINGYTTIEQNENPNDINIPKVIFSEDKRLIYISRKALPGFKEQKNAPNKYYKQVCIYAFSKKELLSYNQFGRKSNLEKSEDIEIVRFLELGQNIRLVKTRPGSLAIDTPEDIPKVESILKSMSELPIS